MPARTRGRIPGPLRFVLAIIGTAAALWLAAVGLIVYAGSHPVLHQADAIVVLGAAQYNGHPSPVYRARIEHALALWQQGLAPRLIFTGGVGVGDTVSEGEVGRQYALKHGAPDSVVLVERLGATSAESVRAAAALMRAHSLRSALLVSDSYHMLRLELLARRAGIRPYRAPAPRAPIDRDNRARTHYVLRESVLFPATAVLGGR
jgi:uncharacterized SAM-binding protein YcdF (DUF218 family)